jgi:hypothetical protein
MVAHERASTFEWTAHKESGYAAGLSEHDVAQILCGGSPTPTTEAEAAAFALLPSLIAYEPPEDEAFEAARVQLGDALLFELICIVGYYQALAVILQSYKITAPGQS